MATTNDTTTPCTLKSRTTVIACALLIPVIALRQYMYRHFWALWEGVQLQVNTGNLHDIFFAPPKGSNKGSCSVVVYHVVFTLPLPSGALPFRRDSRGVSWIDSKCSEGHKFKPCHNKSVLLAPCAGVGGEKSELVVLCPKDVHDSSHVHDFIHLLLINVLNTC